MINFRRLHFRKASIHYKVISPLLLSGLLLWIAACNGNRQHASGSPGATEQPQQDSSTHASPERNRVPYSASSISGCYRHTRERDTLLLQLEQNGYQIY